MGDLLIPPETNNFNNKSSNPSYYRTQVFSLPLCYTCITYLVTVETPSTNFVLKRTLALLNIPSFSETTMN